MELLTAMRALVSTVEYQVVWPSLQRHCRRVRRNRRAYVLSTLVQHYTAEPFSAALLGSLRFNQPYFTWVLEQGVCPWVPEVCWVAGRGGLAGMPIQDVCVLQPCMLYSIRALGYPPARSGRVPCWRYRCSHVFPRA